MPVELFQERDPPAAISYGEGSSGNYVKVTNRFAMTLACGHERACEAAVKEDQGMAQVIVGMEVASDLNELAVVYGITTNHFEWYCLKRSDESVQVNLRPLGLDEYQCPDEGSLTMIAGKLRTPLSD